MIGIIRVHINNFWILSFLKCTLIIDSYWTLAMGGAVLMDGNDRSGSFLYIQEEFSSVEFLQSSYQNLRYTDRFEGSSSVECLLRCRESGRHDDNEEGAVLMIDTTCYCVSKNGGTSSIADGDHLTDDTSKIIIFREKKIHKKKVTQP